MNLIFYRTMPLQVLRSNPWIREVVLDDSGTSYRHTKYTISAVVTYNPSSISYTPVGGAVGPGRNARGLGGGPDTGVVPPVPGGQFVPNTPFVQTVKLPSPARMPADTDVAIRRFLEFPRGQLFVYSTDLLSGQPTNLLLCSPVQTDQVSFAPCDANNGPFCKVNSIQEVAGERMWQIHLVFETCVYEDSLADRQLPPILQSNRWSVNIDTNWQHLTTRVIEGIVHFRADRLILAINPAEFYRNVFATFTVPNGFQRKQVLCKTLPEGNKIAYRIVDAESPYQTNLTASLQSVRLEYTERSWMWQGSFGRALGQSLGWAADNPITAMSAFTNPMSAGVVAAKALQFGLQQLPKRYKTVIARAWGNRNMTRRSLVSIAQSVASARMGTAGLIDTSTAETIITYSSAQMMAEVQTTSKWSFSESAGMLALNLVNLQGFFGSDFAPQGVGDLTLQAFAGQDGDVQGGFLRQQASGTNTPFPNDSNTRGTWALQGPGGLNDPQMFARLATQTLENIGTQNPGAPP